jgi:hypothetical protein
MELPFYLESQPVINDCDGFLNQKLADLQRRSERIRISLLSAQPTAGSTGTNPAVRSGQWASDLQKHPKNQMPMMYRKKRCPRGGLLRRPKDLTKRNSTS